MNVTSAIERLFYPRSIAVIGASDSPDKFSGRALKHLLKSDFKGRFARPAKDSQAAWRAVPRGLDVDRICSFRYDAVVGNDNAVRLGRMILDIPPGPHRRGYAKARVEVRQLLDGRWRVYHKNQLLLEATAPNFQTPLRALRRKRRTLQGVTFSPNS